ncbi:MAG: cell division protein ZapD [Ghiorsea sp.]|nr:cell division protein ZapD [Ghiorsea sp.]
MSNHDLIPVAFPLTPRMQAFIEFRDALRLINQAQDNNSPYMWLAASKEVSDMLLGEGNKKPIVPTILSLFHIMGKHFKDLANKHPDYKDNLMQAASDLEEQAASIRQALEKSLPFLQSDALLTTYSDLTRKQDPLGYRCSLPQVLHHIWHEQAQRSETLTGLLQPIVQAVESLNKMLHAHAPWEQRVAKAGVDQIKLAAQDDIGLLIIGVSPDVITQGIVPICSGFRSIIRLRFEHWLVGKCVKDLTQDQPYSLMMVPIS